MKVVICYSPSDKKPNKDGSTQVYWTDKVLGDLKSQSAVTDRWLKMYSQSGDDGRSYEVLIRVGANTKKTRLPGSHLFLAGVGAIRAARVVQEEFDAAGKPKVAATTA